MLHTNHSRIQEVIMHSNLRLEVPESVLSDGIFKDNKPLSAISLKTLLFLMYYFDGNNASGMMRAVIAAECIGIMPEHEAQI